MYFIYQNLSLVRVKIDFIFDIAKCFSHFVVLPLFSLVGW